MRRLLGAIAMVFGLGTTAWAAAPVPLTTLLAIHEVTNAEAGQALPVEFEATVTYYRSYERTMFVQDGELAIYVQPTAIAKVVPGDRVLIKGTTHASFRPFVVGNSITLLGQGSLPPSVQANFEDLIHARYDCRLATVRATVRTADVVSFSAHSSRLSMVADGGNIDALVDSDDTNALRDMLDAEVEVTGAASGLFDGKMQQTGILLHVSSLAGVKILKRANASPWSLPLTPMDQILTAYHVKNLTQRVRVGGTITYYQPGSALVLQNGTRSLWIMTRTRSDLRIGDEAEATGIPDLHDGFLTLTGAEIQETRVRAPVTPHPADWNELTQSRNIFDLVSIEGQLLMEVRQAAQDEYVLASDGRLFSAVIRHPAATYSAVAAPPLPPMMEVPLGSRIKVTGICILEDSNPFDAQVPFQILMRSFDDIAVVARPSLLSIGNLIRLVSLLLAVVLAISFWGWTLRRKVRRQTAALTTRIEAEAAMERHVALLEQKRSRILEDINGSRPLAEVIEEITEMLSFRLMGAPCWCEIAGGARLGNYPLAADSLRLGRMEIPARSGPPLGVIFAGLDPNSPLAPSERDALSVATKLAAIAIETRRLYSDLRHRSEFDLLTDIHNRFSLDSYLDACIAEARERASIFGLIYVDLDEFKQVNDLYGHHVGDLYLQEVSLRMKGQLRTGDMLARLGGDEFAVLVPMVRNRADIEEIALRLASCFDEPFSVDSYALRGSASVGIAIYPENGATRDSLLNSADAAMYMDKHAKRQAGKIFAPEEA